VVEKISVLVKKYFLSLRENNTGIKLIKLSHHKSNPGDESVSSIALRRGKNINFIILPKYN
jgi:hypothetical protein